MSLVSPGYNCPWLFLLFANDSASQMAELGKLAQEGVIVNPKSVDWLRLTH